MNAPAHRDERGHWLPGGLSPNPGGRPRVVAEIRELAREYLPAAIEKIGRLINSNDERVALAASQEILNRIFGKPMVSVDSEVRKLDVGALWLAAMRAANGNPADVVVDVTPPTDQLDDEPAPDLIATTSSDDDPEW